MHGDPERSGVRDLDLPVLLIELIETGRWKHPGDAALARAVPWFKDPVDFPTHAQDMERHTRGFDQLADDEESAALFHLVRPRDGAALLDLPWLEAERAIVIAICRYAGDDTAIVLDYRIDPANPRVVGSDAWTDPHQYHWRTIASTFSAFAEALGLTGRSTPGIVPA